MSMRYSAYLLTPLLLYFVLAIDPTYNDFSYERCEVKLMPNSGLTMIKNKFKKLNYTTANVEVVVSLNRTYHSIFVHGVVYRQFSSYVYRRGAWDLWQDVCKLMDGDDLISLARMARDRVLPYTNGIRRCPYPPGIYYGRVNGLRSEMLNFGYLLPSGRFRAEANMTDGYKGTVLATVKLYFSISDHRVEQF